MFLPHVRKVFVQAAAQELVDLSASVVTSGLERVHEYACAYLTRRFCCKRAITIAA